MPPLRLRPKVRVGGCNPVGNKKRDNTKGYVLSFFDDCFFVSLLTDVKKLCELFTKKFFYIEIIARS